MRLLFAWRCGTYPCGFIILASFTGRARGDDYCVPVFPRNIRKGVTLGLALMTSLHLTLDSRISKNAYKLVLMRITWFPVKSTLYFNSALCSRYYISRPMTSMRVSRAAL